MLKADNLEHTGKGLTHGCDSLAMPLTIAKIHLPEIAFRWANFKSLRYHDAAADTTHQLGEIII